MEFKIYDNFETFDIVTYIIILHKSLCQCYRYIDCHFFIFEWKCFRYHIWWSLSMRIWNTWISRSSNDSESDFFYDDHWFLKSKFIAYDSFWNIESRSSHDILLRFRWLFDIHHWQKWRPVENSWFFVKNVYMYIYMYISNWFAPWLMSNEISSCTSQRLDHSFDLEWFSRLTNESKLRHLSRNISKNDLSQYFMIMM